MFWHLCRKKGYTLKTMKNKIADNKIPDMYEKMYLIRKCEEKIYLLFKEGIMPGTIRQT